MFKTIDEIKAANKAAGHNWFSPDTMRYWHTRVGKTVYGGRYFVTSDGPGGRDKDERRYTVREASPSGEVSTADGCTYGEFATHAEAAKRARELASVVAADTTGATVA